MDVNDLRVAVTLVSLVLFIALLLHTWSRRRRADHDEAAMLPFTGDLVGQQAAKTSRGENT
jgi:cytochrome c oxidase cbb3-type subunit 4